MHEIVGTFLWAELRDERANCSIEARNSSRCNLAEECLEFAVSHLDRVEVGRVFRQVTKGRVRFLDRCPNARPEMDAAIVHHNNVVTFERGNQALHDISENISPVMAPSTTIGAVISLWRKAATKVMVCHAPSGTLPITRSPRGARPLSRTRFVLTAVSSMNTSRAGSNMPCSRIHRRRASATSAPCCSAACRLFLRVMLCRSRNRQSELRLVLIRRLRSSATVSTRVRSGCSATRARIALANFSSGETLPPRGFGAALLLSRQRCSHLIAELTLTSNRSAASRRDAPLATVSITRSRRSPE